MHQEAKDLSQFRKELEEIHSLTYEEQPLYMTKAPCISVLQQHRFCTQIAWEGELLLLVDSFHSMVMGHGTESLILACVAVDEIQYWLLVTPFLVAPLLV